MAKITASGWSGLYDGVHNASYETIDHARGGVNSPLMVQAQKRGNWAWTQEAGLGVPTNRAVVDANEGALSVRGVYNYPARTQGTPVSIPNAYLGGDRGNSDVAVVPEMTAADFGKLGDVTYNQAYAKDLADHGATSPADVPERKA